MLRAKFCQHANDATGAGSTIEPHDDGVRARIILGELQPVVEFACANIKVQRYRGFMVQVIRNLKQRVDRTHVTGMWQE